MIPFPEEARAALVAAGYPEDELEPSDTGAFLLSHARTVILDFHPTRVEGWRANLQDHGRVVAIADGTTAERALRAALVVAGTRANS